MRGHVIGLTRPPDSFDIQRWRTFVRGFRVSELVCTVDWMSVEGEEWSDETLDHILEWVAAEYEIPPNQLFARY